jgi:hypothetical protein
MARIKSLVIFGFFAVLTHNLHAAPASVGTIRCAPRAPIGLNFDFPTQASGLPATTSTEQNTFTITATGTVTLKLRATIANSNPSPVITLGGQPVAGAPTSWAAWQSTGCPVVAGSYNVSFTINNPGVGVQDPYFVVAGISDTKGGCEEDWFHGMIGAGVGGTNFGTPPPQAQLDQLTTCTGGGGGGGGTDTGTIAGPGSGNAPPNNKDRFKVLLNTGGRRLLVGQIQGKNFTSFGGLGSFNARNSLRHGDKLRLFYVPMIPISPVSAGGCCVSAFTGASNNSNGGSGNRAVVVRTRLSRGSGRVSHRRR